MVVNPGEALENVPRSARRGRARRQRRGHAREDRAAMSDDRRAFFRGLVRSAARDDRPAARAAEPPPAPADPDSLRAAEVDRYSRQLVLPEWSEPAQLALRDASVLVVGAGALGSPVAAYLTGAGRRAARDRRLRRGRGLEPARASGCTSRPTSASPRPRARRRSCASSTPRSIVEPYHARFAPAMLEGADLVVDCSDSFETRYEVNAACCAARIAARRGRRARAQRPRDGDPAGRHRVLPLRLPRGAALGAELRGGRRARPGGGRDRLAAGARGAEAAGRARRRAARRVPPGRPPRPHVPARRHVPPGGLPGLCQRSRP